MDMAEPSDRSVATSSGNLPDVDEATSEDQAVAETMPTGSRLGLLDLPPEIRLMVYRNLVRSPNKINFLWSGPEAGIFPNILRTNKLICGEASGVLYGENRFSNLIGSQLVASSFHYSLSEFPRVRDTMQNIDFDILLDQKSLAIKRFLVLKKLFEDPSIIRGTLTLRFYLDGLGTRLLGWFLPALGRLTNFRAIELHFKDFISRDHVRHVVEYLKSALEPGLGPAKDGRRGEDSLRFHPVHYRNRCRIEPIEIDWVEYLRRARLEWGGE